MVHHESLSFIGIRQRFKIKVEVQSVMYFVKYDVLSEYLTPFWFAMLLNEYEIEFMFRKI